LPFIPQHFTAPESTKHACRSPAEIAATPESALETATGAVLTAEFPETPLPNCPYVLLPQHFAAPDTTAHEKDVASPQSSPPPTEIAETPVVKPVTETGVLDEMIVELPNWPLPLSPQHFAAPETTAHACTESELYPEVPPIDTAVTPEVKPDTDTGVDELVVKPLPNWPLPLAPQHFTAPDTTAHE
jgi:hypothetical protein